MSIADLSIWTPVTCFAACAGVYVIGECLSRLTKGNVSSLMFASAIFLFGFWLVKRVTVTHRHARDNKGNKPKELRDNVPDVGLVIDDVGHVE